jgi:hypothetical protein
MNSTPTLFIGYTYSQEIVHKKNPPPPPQALRITDNKQGWVFVLQSGVILTMH